MTIIQKIEYHIASVLVQKETTNMTLDEPKHLFADSDKDTDRLIGRVLAGMSQISWFSFHIQNHRQHINHSYTMRTYSTFNITSLT